MSAFRQTTFLLALVFFALVAHQAHRAGAQPVSSFVAEYAFFAGHFRPQHFNETFQLILAKEQALGAGAVAAGLFRSRVASPRDAALNARTLQHHFLAMSEFKASRKLAALKQALSKVVDSATLDQVASFGQRAITPSFYDSIVQLNATLQTRLLGASLVTSSRGQFRALVLGLNAIF